MAALVRIIRVDIALMTSKWLLLLLAASLLSGCAGKANHPQCQNLKDEAAGAQFGAALAGTYMAQIKADMDERQYERCEEMFDMAQYQAQLQEEQAQAQAQLQAQERQQVLRERANSPEMQEKLKTTSLKDLVICEKAVQNKNDTHPDDVKAMASFVCEREIDRRVGSGKVSRDTVDKMLAQS